MIVKCKNCGKEFDKRPDQIKKTKNHFCSRSCAATYNNKKYPKRIATNFCTDCGINVTESSTKRCHNCHIKYSMGHFNEKKLKDVLYKKADASLKFVLVRKKAKRVLELEGRAKKCEKCGWDKHVHTAHITPLSSYSLDTKIKVVNSPDNLIYLCPNCHWEFDHKDM